MPITAHDRPARILLADADDTTRAFLADNLTADGYDVIPVATEPAALAELARPDRHRHGARRRRPPHPDLRRPRAADPSLAATLGDVAVIVLTSRGEQVRHTRLMKRGAHDVVTKPFSYAELRARPHLGLPGAHRPPDNPP